MAGIPDEIFGRHGRGRRRHGFGLGGGGSFWATMMTLGGGSVPPGMPPGLLQAASRSSSAGAATGSAAPMDRRSKKHANLLCAIPALLPGGGWAKT
jgi:hypothetical protein